MEPTSPLVLILAFGIAAGLVVAVSQARNVILKAACGLFALVLATLGGIVAVNDYYGYYRSWSAAVNDLTGHVATMPAGHTARRTINGRSVVLRYGRLVELRLSGKASGITRLGYVYLPPQYGEPAYRQYRFPVVELFHGSPGLARNWLNQLNAPGALDSLLATQQSGPVVLVMPNSNQGARTEECLNSRFGKDETYLTTDVRADVLARFRVSADPAQWGLLGYSSGGYCAANLAMRHRQFFGAAAIMDGYFRPTDGPAARILRFNSALEAANDPLAAAETLRPTAPLPAFWVYAGTGDGADLQSARQFVTEIRRVGSADLVVQQGARHNFYGWADAEPAALAWLWEQLASPDQRLRFPVVGSGVSGGIPNDARANRAGTHHHAKRTVVAQARRPGVARVP